jgi:hypothetical protein
MTADVEYTFEEVRAIAAENEQLRKANQLAVDRAVQSHLAVQALAELKLQLEPLRAKAKAFDALAEVARAVHALLPPDALKDAAGDRVVALGLTQPQLLRALLDRAAVKP